MVFYTSPIPCIILALAIGLHLVSMLLRGWRATAVTAVNICLHALLAAAELYLGGELAEITLLYSLSLLIYLLLAVFLMKRENGSERRDDGDL